MFNIFKTKSLIEENNRLKIENAKLTVELEKINKADRILAKIVDEKIDISQLNMSTEGEAKKVAREAREVLNNRVFQHVMNNGRYNSIMGAIKEARDYPELVQKRGNLLYVENTILKTIRDLSHKDEGLSSDQNNDDFDFINNN